MVNKILKKETFEICLQYCITRQKWAGVRRPLAWGPYHKGAFLKDLWLKDLQNQRTFGQRIFAPKDLFQKDLLSKGAFGKRTFCPKDLLVLSLKSKYYHFFTVLFFCLNEFAYGFFVLTERPLFAAFIFAAVAPFFTTRTNWGVANCHASKVQTGLWFAKRPKKIVVRKWGVIFSHRFQNT